MLFNIPLDSKMQSQIQTCTHVKFPKHSQVHHRQPYGKSLFKKVKTRGGNVILRPLLVYCYKSVIDSLQEMLSQPDFFNRCEAWWTMKESPEVYRDVYDGKIWQDFQVSKGNPFFLCHITLPFNST